MTDRFRPYGLQGIFIQIFLNLVKNAAEAVDETRGDIELSTAFRPGQGAKRGQG